MTTREILKQTGLSDEQINALDAKILGGFDTVLTTASADREAAELAQRAQNELYEKQIAPALDSWGVEKTTLEAERDFYRTQAQGAKGAGFLPKEAPGFVPPQDPATGKFVAGGNAVPGSPGFTAQDGITAISNATWAFQEHARLFGQPAPDDFETLLKEATSRHLPFREHVSSKYKFAEKKAEMSAKAQQDLIDSKVKDAVAARDREWAEKGGNNPALRQGVSSQFSQVRKAVEAGTRKDPLTLSSAQRREQTRQNIQTEFADNAAATIN